MVTILIMKSAGNVFEVDKGGTLTLTVVKATVLFLDPGCGMGRGVLVSNGTFNMYGSKICNNTINVQAEYRANGAAQVDKTLICMVARLSGSQVSAWVEQFLVWTLLI